MNRKFSNVSEKEIQKYCKDKVEIDKMAQCLYDHNMTEVVRIMIQGFIHGQYFRKIFLEKFINKIRLNKIYSNKELS